ncbi:MAG: helicase-related protein [Rickettsiales bacterium]
MRQLINQSTYAKIKEIIFPVYNLTYGLTNKSLHTIIFNLFFYIKSNTLIQKELLSYDFNRKNYLSFWVAIKNIHIPVSFDIMQKSTRRLELDELLAHKLILLNAKSNNKEVIKPIITKATKLQEQILTKLNFILTSSQAEVLIEIEQDQFNSKKQMSRLLQGDVGSGKTLIALLTALNVVISNSKNQVAIIAPISLLANQHYNFFENALQEVLQDFNIKIALLTSTTTKIKRKKILDELKSGEINILIGTQAIIQADVEFNNLVYAIIDEQHRFGVEQRAEILKKGAIDILMMTATPIPRTMQIIYYNEMDVSIMQNKIATQKPIITSIMSSYKTEDVITNLYQSLSNENNKHKAYWICPLKTQVNIDDKVNDIENVNLLDNNKINNKNLTDNKKINLISAEERFDILQKKLTNIPIHLLTSDTKSAKKYSIIAEFQEQKPQIIVATTVIEVGIDVKDATIIVIENAQQFGLSQLHQIRGRVGRGSLQSYCILIYNAEYTSKKAKYKLQVLKENNDGFIIADKDLALRGFGEIFGTKQSGESQFYFLNFESMSNFINTNNLKESSNFYEEINKELIQEYKNYFNNYYESHYDISRYNNLYQDINEYIGPCHNNQPNNQSHNINQSASPRQNISQPNDMRYDNNKLNYFHYDNNQPDNQSHNVNQSASSRQNIGQPSNTRQNINQLSDTRQNLTFNFNKIKFCNFMIDFFIKNKIITI